MLLVANFLVQYLVGAALYDARHSLGVTHEQLSALVVVLANGLVLTAVMHHRGMTYRDLFHPAAGSMRAALFLLVPPTLLLLPLIVLLDHSMIEFLEFVFPVSQWEAQAFSGMVDGQLATAVATCILAPVLEEMLFRGVLLRSFLAQYPRWAAISYSALFFGAAHLNVYQFFLAFFLGLLFGWLFERSRSLIPSIALHAAVNVWAVFGGAVSFDPQRMGSPLLSWAMAAAAAIVGALALNRLLRPTQRHDAERAA